MHYCYKLFNMQYVDVWCIFPLNIYTKITVYLYTIFINLFRGRQFEHERNCQFWKVKLAAAFMDTRKTGAQLPNYDCPFYTKGRRVLFR